VKLTPGCILAKRAIFCCFVDTVFGDSNVSPCVAQLKFYNPASPFPPQAPSRVSFPDSTVLWRC